MQGPLECKDNWSVRLNRSQGTYKCLKRDYRQWRSREKECIALHEKGKGRGVGGCTERWPLTFTNMLEFVREFRWRRAF